MRVVRHFGDFALQPDAARFVAFQFKLFRHDGHDFPGVKAAFLRRHCLGKRAGGKSIDLFAGDGVFFRQIFSRLDHVDARRRVFERFPHVILEADRRAQLEAGAVVKGGNRVARHAFGADDQRRFASAALNLLARLAKQLKARAANALGHQRGHFDWHARIQADVARQKELVKVAGGHIARNH